MKSFLRNPNVSFPILFHKKYHRQIKLVIKILWPYFQLSNELQFLTFGACVTEVANFSQAPPPSHCDFWLIGVAVGPILKRSCNAFHMYRQSILMLVMFKDA